MQQYVRYNNRTQSIMEGYIIATATSQPRNQKTFMYDMYVYVYVYVLAYVYIYVYVYVNVYINVYVYVYVYVYLHNRQGTIAHAHDAGRL